jgi:DNA repair exonuclease SbcCD nuclease subunit
MLQRPDLIVGMGKKASIGESMMIRFLHTSDWQLGMTRHFFSEGAQERFSQARFDAIRTMGRVASEQDCRFMLVCGDAFESNQVDRKTVARALEALKDVPVPVFLLPGNHDPLNAASVYRSSTFVDKRPEHVHVIDTTAPLLISEGVELVSAPWRSKRLIANPVDEVLAALQPAEGITRICMAHGTVDSLTPYEDAPAVINIQALESAIADGRVHFVALGDRHSLTKVGAGERIWFSGTPEPTDFSETQSGYAQIVEISDGRIDSKAVEIGQWQFIEWDRVDLNTAEDVEALRDSINDMERKELTVLKLKLVGSISMSLECSLQDNLAAAQDLFGALLFREDELFVQPNDADFDSLDFSGFADLTVKRLRALMAEGEEEGLVARDALMLLLRLAREAA